MKHGNIGIFIPHLGCPHDCVFCNQRHISGTKKAPTPNEVREILLKASQINKSRSNIQTEIAFFGGSFTAIDREYMTELLKVANEFKNDFTGIRISTRPDCIDAEVLSLLNTYGVTDIELGVQSMDGEVLKASNRGHTSLDVINASRLIREYGFNLGHQMMTGLPLDTEEKAVKTAEQIIALKPDTIRIYPTLVIKDTYLEEMYRKGEYMPQTVNEAAELCARLILMFEEANIKIIRVGLHSDGIENSFLAGPFHPAFGEICESKIYLQLAEKAIIEAESFSGKLFVNLAEISKAIGQHRVNAEYLSKKYGMKITVHGDESLSKRQITAK